MYRNDLCGGLPPAIASGDTVFPEWINQRLQIAAGEATWADFSFEQRTCKGWLLPYLFSIESMFAGRWDYWLRTLEKGAIPDEPIPQIDFLDFPDTKVMKNLKDCLTAHLRYGFGLSDFFQWLLWGFGEQGERARISDEANEYWYKTFNLGLLLESPHDYLGHILSEEKAGNWSNPNAFYPTPHTICSMMVQMQFADAKRQGQDLKDKSVCDPCVGTGRMLMYASNHSLFLYGGDIDRTCVMACKINGYLYMPWLVRPDLADPRLKQADAIQNLPMPQAVKAGNETAETDVVLKPYQLSLF